MLTEDDQSGEPPRLTGRFFQGLAEAFRYPKTLFSSSGFGVFMGILPGVGEFLAQFFSYTLAQKTSKTPDLFGKGAPEGLIASESANNAVPAAALVPLLALGIPGEALTAMMLSVFMVHNVIRARNCSPRARIHFRPLPVPAGDEHRDPDFPAVRNPADRGAVARQHQVHRRHHSGADPGRHLHRELQQSSIR